MKILTLNNPKRIVIQIRDRTGETPSKSILLTDTTVEEVYVTMLRFLAQLGA